MTPTLETQRLLLKPASLNDCAALQPLFNNWNVVQYLANVPWPYPADGVTSYTRDKLFPDMAAGRLYAWTITDKVSNRYMGRIDLRPHFLERSTEHWGYWIGEPFQGKGFMGETLNAVAGFAFGTLNMPLITARVAKANAGSTKLQQALGACNSAENIGSYVSGECEQIVWAVTPEAWRASALKQKYG